MIVDEQTVDGNAMKPVLKLTLQAGHLNVGWKRQGMGSLEIQMDRGNGVFAYLASNTVPDYLDTAASAPAARIGQGTKPALRGSRKNSLRDSQSPRRTCDKVTAIRFP